MPIYEYQCDTCSHRFEVKQSIKEDPIAACERCGKAVRRLISSPGIMFKGSGWYVTDYSDKMKPPIGESTSAPAGDKKEPASASTTAAPPPTSTTPAATSTSGGGASSTGSTPPAGTTPKSE